MWCLISTSDIYDEGQIDKMDKNAKSMTWEDFKLGLGLGQGQGLIKLWSLVNSPLGINSYYNGKLLSEIKVLMFSMPPTFHMPLAYN